MSNDYVTLGELKKTLSLSGENFADPDLRLAIAAASRGIDRAARRRFWLDEDANQVRHYSPTRESLLLIDDLVTFTSLELDRDGDGTFEQTWTFNTDVVLEPLNAPAEGKPYIAIRAHPKGSYGFPCDYPRTVKLTGKFGWPEVPEPIKQATSIIASRLMRRGREAPFGVVSLGMEGAAARIARTDPDLAFLLGPYTRGTGG